VHGWRFPPGITVHRDIKDVAPQGAVALRQPLFEFEVESLMFDVDVFLFKAIASNIIHQT